MTSSPTTVSHPSMRCITRWRMSRWKAKEEAAGRGRPAPTQPKRPPTGGLPGLLEQALRSPLVPLSGLLRCQSIVLLPLSSSLGRNLSSIYLLLPYLPYPPGSNLSETGKRPVETLLMLLEKGKPPPDLPSWIKSRIPSVS